MARGKGRPPKTKPSEDQTKANEEETTERKTEDVVDNATGGEGPEQEKTEEADGREHAEEQPPVENAEYKEAKGTRGKNGNEQPPADKAVEKKVKAARGKKGNNSKKAKEAFEEDKAAEEPEQEAVGEDNQKEEKDTGNRKAKEVRFENESETAEAKPGRPRRGARPVGKDSARGGEEGDKGNVVQQYQDLEEGTKGKRKQQQKRRLEKETGPEKQVGDAALEGNVASATSKESGKTREQNKILEKISLTSEELRVLIRYHFDEGLSAAEAGRRIRGVCRDVVSDTMCKKWFQRFRDGNREVADRPGAGRPREMDSEAVQALLDEDPTQATRDMAEALGVDHTTVWNRLKEMGKVNKWGRWMPHILTEGEKRGKHNLKRAAEEDDAMQVDELQKQEDAPSQPEDLTGFSCTEHLLDKDAKVLQFKLTRGRKVKILAVEEAKKSAMSTCFDYMVQKMLE